MPERQPQAMTCGMNDLAQTGSGAPAQSPAPEGGRTRRRPPRRRRVLPLLLLALVAIAGVAGALWWKSRGGETVRYVTAPASRGAVTRTVTATGTVNPELTIIVGTYVSGVIQELYCDYNTRVTKGQICARIDQRPYQTLVDQARANLAVAKAQHEKDLAALDYAKANYDRQQYLVERKTVSQDVADNARSVYRAAAAQVDLSAAQIQQRQAELATAQVNLDYTNIVSPVDGTVVSRNVTMGQTVAASFQTPTLFLIATDLTRMQVDTNVSESDIGGIKEGNSATFTVDAFPNRTFRGAVSQVRQSPQTAQNVVTYDVVVSVDNSDLALKPGMTASTRVVMDQRTDVLRVPNQAVRYIPGGLAGTETGLVPVGSGQTRLWLLRDGSAVPVIVTLGLDDDSFTEIVKGDLKPGDQVIVAEQRNGGQGTPAVQR
jgi:HlyD family secretion protein